MREVAAGFENPVMLYSIGKDSLGDAAPGDEGILAVPPAFPLHARGYDLEVPGDGPVPGPDHGKKLGLDLIVHINEDGLKRGINPYSSGSNLHTQVMKTEGLRQAMDKYRFDAAFGGARRDEEKSRAKERIFSFRTESHGWDPKSQRPELWSLYNTRKAKGESIRVFPISNWTELDIWAYIAEEEIPIVPLYFGKERPTVIRNGQIFMVDDDAHAAWSRTRFPLSSA